MVRGSISHRLAARGRFSLPVSKRDLSEMLARVSVELETRSIRHLKALEHLYLLPKRH